MRKIGVICLSLLLALGLLGVGYAAWTDEIVVTGDVSTGEVKLGVFSCSLLDSIAPINPGGDFPTTNPDWSIAPGFVSPPFLLDKNVAWGECELSDSNGDGVNDTVTVTFHNTYPCYFNVVNFYPYNAGTIPIRINSVLIEWDGGSQLITSSPYYVGMDINGDGYDDIEILWGNNFGAELNPGGFPVEVSFWIHVLQEAPQNASLSFTATMMAVQWDEYPYTPNNSNGGTTPP